MNISVKDRGADMEDVIEKVNPVNAEMDVKISGEKKIKYRKTTRGHKTPGFTEVFWQKIEKADKREENKPHAKYKNGRRIK